MLHTKKNPKPLTIMKTWEGIRSTSQYNTQHKIFLKLNIGGAFKVIAAKE
jgi:hypothetical protein